VTPDTQPAAKAAYVTANLMGRLTETIMVAVSDETDIELVGLVEKVLRENPGKGQRDVLGDYVVTPDGWRQLHRVLLRAGVRCICGMGVAE
jgi:hypothetical protein